MTLQPLVENAILHGTMEKEYDQGEKAEILIKGDIVAGEIMLSVIDNGIGIEEGKIKKITQLNENIKDVGYGIGNIDQRIKVHFGRKYGLFYEKQPSVGTRVDIRLPLEDK